MGARYGAFGSFDVDQRGLYPRELDQLTRLPWSLDDDATARIRLLQLGGVSHVVALHTKGFETLREIARFPSVYAEPIRVFRVEEPLPRSYVAEGVRVVPDDQALAALVDPRFDFRREVLLTEGLPPRRPGGDSAGESRVVSYLPDRVEMDVTARRAAVVVLLDSFDPGWRAWVDGEPAPHPPGERRIPRRPGAARRASGRDALPAPGPLPRDRRLGPDGGDRPRRRGGPRPRRHRRP